MWNTQYKPVILNSRMNKEQAAQRMGLDKKNQKRIVLTDEQFVNLREAANNFVFSVASGWDMEVEEGERFDDAIIEHIVKPFIEPLINKEL